MPSYAPAKPKPQCRAARTQARVAMLERNARMRRDQALNSAALLKDIGRLPDFRSKLIAPHHFDGAITTLARIERDATASQMKLSFDKALRQIGYALGLSVPR